METALKERATRMTPLEFQADRQDRQYRWRWPFDPIGESLIEHYLGAFTIHYGTSQGSRPSERKNATNEKRMSTHLKKEGGLQRLHEVEGTMAQLGLSLLSSQWRKKNWASDVFMWHSCCPCLRPFFGHTLQHQPIMRIDCPRTYDFVWTAGNTYRPATERFASSLKSTWDFSASSIVLVALPSVIVKKGVCKFVRHNLRLHLHWVSTRSFTQRTWIRGIQQRSSNICFLIYIHWRFIMPLVTFTLNPKPCIKNCHITHRGWWLWLPSSTSGIPIFVLAVPRSWSLRWFHLWLFIQ